MTSQPYGNRTSHPRQGQIRDAVISILAQSRTEDMALSDIQNGVQIVMGRNVSSSSVRSSLNLHVGTDIVRTGRGRYALASRIANAERPAIEYGAARLFVDDCFTWMSRQTDSSIHAVVTDPPYGAEEYSAKEQAKLRQRSGGLWRIPPTLDGVRRSPVPRFTTMNQSDHQAMADFFTEWAHELIRILVPGANVLVATNPLVSHIVSSALDAGGLERRGEIIRLVQTLRGGDRPKGAHDEFPEVSVMPRSQWEPWLIYRKPIVGTVADNLRTWGTGGFRRISHDRPFGDVVKAPPARGRERAIAPHPSLKPQALLRHLVRGVLPLGTGVVLDPFAGSGSTLAAAEAVGYRSVGVERDPQYAKIARTAIPELAELALPDEHQPASLVQLSLPEMSSTLPEPSAVITG